MLSPFSDGDEARPCEMKDGGETVTERREYAAGFNIGVG